MVISIGGCSPSTPLDEAPPIVEWPPAAPLDLEVELELSDPASSAEPDGLEVERVFAEDVSVEKAEAAGFRYLDVQLGRTAEGEARPLIVVLHGRGDRPRIPGGPFEGLPLPVRVIVPRAPDPLGTGFSWLPVRVAEGKPEILGFSLAQMAGRLAELIRHVRASRPTLGPTIVTGFSQGGLLTYALAVRHPDVVGRAFPHAGWLPPLLVPPERAPDLVYPPIRSMHGTADLRVPVEPTRQMMIALSEAGFDVELHEFPGVEHVMSEEMDALFHEWLVHAVLDAAGITPPDPIAPLDEVSPKSERPIVAHRPPDLPEDVPLVEEPVAREDEPRSEAEIEIDTEPSAEIDAPDRTAHSASDDETDAAPLGRQSPKDEHVHPG